MMATIHQVSNFWDVQPCNSKDSFQGVGTREYFDETEAQKYREEQHILPFADFSQWKGKKILEIGTGIGIDAVNFARAGALYTGVDLSEKSLALCKERFNAYGLIGHFYCGNSEELSLFVPVESYDCIYSFGVIHHTPHPKRVFDELKKYCSPTTELRIMLYAKWSWKVLRIILVQGKGAFWRRDELVRRNSEAQANCPVIYTYTFKEVRDLMKDFEILEIKKEYLSLWGTEKEFVYDLPLLIRRWLEHLLGWNILIVARRSDS